MITRRIRFLVLSGFLGIGIIFSSAAFHATRAQAGILYVAPEGACGAAAPCYASVQTAVDAAESGDEIRIAGGIYPLPDGSDQIVHISKSLALRGGFTIADWQSADPDANPTLLDGLGQGRVMVISGPISVTVEGVRLVYGSAQGLGGAALSKDAGGALYIDEAAVILRHSWVAASMAVGGEGGGIYVNGSSGTFTMQSCQVKYNIAESGGGVFLNQADAVLTDNLFASNNSAGNYYGSGIRIQAGSAVLTGNTFNENQGGSGGGISASFANLQIDHNSFQKNTAERGGGIHLDQCTAVLDANLFQSNSAADGGGIYAFRSTFSLTRSSLLENDAKRAGGMYGGGLWVDTSLAGEVLIRENLIQGNRASDGAGINIFGAAPAFIEDNLILDNIASDTYYHGHGGGLFIDAAGVTLNRNLIQRNLAVQGSNVLSNAFGGGLAITKTVTLTNNIITGNQVEGDNAQAPGIYVHGASPSLYHNTIAGNTGGDGSGIFAAQEEIEGTPSQLSLYNTLIANQATGIFVSDESPQNMATLYGILWWGNTSDFQGAVTVYDALHGDPLFVDASASNYHLSDGSAAINQSPAAWVEVDIDKQPRLDTPDLGADEYWAPGTLTRIFLPLLKK